MKEYEQSFRAFSVTYWVAVQLLSNVGFDAEFFSQLPSERDAMILARLHLASGKFPLERVFCIALTLANQNLPVTFDYRDYYFH